MVPHYHQVTHLAAGHHVRSQQEVRRSSCEVTTGGQEVTVCTLYSGLRPPTALLTTSIFTPSSFMILTGRVHIHSG